MDLKNFKLMPFYDLDKKWAILTSGDKEKFNQMTVSWGGFGTIWNKPVVTVYVRHNRYTYEFIENNVSFLMSDYLEQIFIKECLYSVISGVMQKGYTKKKILSITVPLEKKYNSWYNNSYIKELNFKNRVVLTLYHYRMFFLLKFVFYLKKKIYKY